MRIGKVDGARQLADTLEPGRRLDVYGLIAATQRDAGDDAGARTTLQAALDLARRRLEDFDAANRVRGELMGAERNRLLASLGRLQAKLGDRKPAFETIQQINDGTQQLEALEGMGADLASAGDLDGALEAVGRMNSPKAEAQALEAVASAFSRREPAPAARR